MKEWYTELMQKCVELQIEFCRETYSVIFLCARMPSHEIQEKLIKYIPDGLTHTFIEGPKTKTIYLLSNLCQTTVNKLRGGVISQVNIIPKLRLFVFDIVHGEDTVPEDDPFYDKVTKILLDDGFFDSWSHNKKVIDLKVHKAISKAASGDKPKRDTVILEDEILDLNIILNDPKMTWDKFLETV